MGTTEVEINCTFLHPLMAVPSSVHHVASPEALCPTIGHPLSAQPCMEAHNDIWHPKCHPQARLHFYALQKYVTKFCQRSYSIRDLLLFNSTDKSLTLKSL